MLIPQRLLVCRSADQAPGPCLRSLLFSSAAAWLMYAPIRGNGEIIGTFVIEQTAPDRQWSAAEQCFAASLGDAAGSLLQAAEYRRLKAEVNHARELENLGLLSSAFAHDLNNLVMSIVGSAGLLLSDLSANEKNRSRVERIKSAAERAGGLANQLRLFLGNDKLAVHPLNLSAVVAETKLLLGTLVSKKAEFCTVLAEDLPLIAADTSQIRQLLVNLVTNADEALENKKGRITLRTGREFLSDARLSDCVCAENVRAGDYVYLEVADTGRGIAKEHQARIFDPFFSTKTTGRGLGLAGVLGIARAYGGALIMASDAGAGTTFRVLFRYTPNFNEQHGMTEKSDKSANHLFLVADDQVLLLEVTKTVLSANGFETLCAQNGEEALRLYRQHAPALSGVLLDLEMPGINGRQVLRQMREIDARVPIILTSGWGEDDYPNADLPAGYSAYMKKPFLPDELMATVRSVCRKG